MHRLRHAMGEPFGAAERGIADRPLCVVHDAAWAQAVLNHVDGVTELRARPLDVRADLRGAYLVWVLSHRASSFSVSIVCRGFRSCGRNAARPARTRA